MRILAKYPMDLIFFICSTNYYYIWAKESLKAVSHQLQCYMHYAMLQTHACNICYATDHTRGYVCLNMLSFLAEREMYSRGLENIYVMDALLSIFTAL